MDYRDAGVDVQAGRSFVQQIKTLVETTARPEMLGHLGGFSGLFELPSGYRQPVLVSGTDGVGTKLKLAQALNCHQSVGIDLVAMSVNDVLTCGAEPLFFLDYLATSHLDPEQLTQVITGITQGCQLAGCALLGGETAEMPGFYQPQEYDLAGFCVGIVEKSALCGSAKTNLGDIVIGLASQGVHSNGFSLVRKIVAEGHNPTTGQPGWQWSDCPPVLGGASLGDCLLRPTQIYVKPVLSALRAGLQIHSMAHITGGGLPENLPRAIRSDQSIQLFADQWPLPPVFKWLATAGQVDLADMYDTFNMGIGFALLVSPKQVAATLQHFSQEQLPAYVIGEVIPGQQTVTGIPLVRS